MTSRIRIRIAGIHAEALRNHLFSGDGNEAVAFALCGRHRNADFDVLLVWEIHPIPLSECSYRGRDCVTWKTNLLEPLLERACNQKLAIVKFHSHPNGFSEFSVTDDESDRDLFKSIYGWVDDEGPHASVVLLPNGELFGRAVDLKNQFVPIEQILIADHDIGLFAHSLNEKLPTHAQRHAQLFGNHTTSLLRQLSVGIVGCSGTGSFVIEMLARLGVCELVLVDPDRVEYRNLNRIIGTTSIDAALGRLKVQVLAEHVARMGLDTRVMTVPTDLATIEAVKALAGCDVLFGCMDSHDGRRILNKLACFYVLPYFDCGVGLRADGNGGIDDVSVASHYVQPGRSTLQGRRVILQKRADAEAIARGNPELYRSLRAEKYIEGVEVDSPAVISINALAASLLVNEFLARLHPFRLNPNEKYCSIRLNLMDMSYVDLESETGDQPMLRALGRGDVEPLLDMPELTSRA